eukprot:gene30328-39557_t
MRVSPQNPRSASSYEFPEGVSVNGSIGNDLTDSYSASFLSTSTTDSRTICEAFKAHAEKSLYRIPPYILTDRLNISTSMNRNEIQVEQFIFRGKKCEIYTANVNFLQTVVIKKATNEAFAEKDILNEIQMLTKIKHKNIIAIKGARTTNLEPFMVLETLGGGTLSDVIEGAQGTLLPRGRALDIAHQLISAIHYLHEELSPYAMMIHRDLHPKNVGFTSRSQLKLFDFGIAVLVKKRMFRLKTYKMTNINGGDNSFLAPEALFNQPYNEKVDIFSFGVILRLLLIGVTAVPQEPDEDLDGTIVEEGTTDNSSPEIEPDRRRYPAVNNASLMQLLIDQCTVEDYYLRPSGTVILRHLREEIAAHSSNTFFGWGMRKSRAISKRISRIFRPTAEN